jgi:hypothetical protein
MGLPQPAQNFTPGLFCRPQLVQKAGPVAGVAACATGACKLCPQLVQKAMPVGTSVWQATHVCVNG